MKKNRRATLRRQRAICAGILACGLTSPAPQAEAAVFHPQSYTLANGMQIVVVQGALSPALSQMVWYKTGAADDPAGKSGLAHYLEHLMFKGTKALPAGAFSALIAGQGGQENAFTGQDSTAYYISIAADRLPLTMQMEADRMRFLLLDPGEAASERAVVLSERQQRTGNNPQGLFEEKLDAALFPGHPYGRPVIGWREEIEKLAPDDARTYYQTHYAPNNAVLVVSGDVEPPEVARIAAATFGRLPAAPLPPRPALSLPSPPTQKRVEMADSRVAQAQLTRRFLAPSRLTGGCRAAAALEVLAETLAGGEVGVLYRDIVTRQRLASALDVFYDPTTRGPAVFALSAVPAPGQEARDLEKKIDAALEKTGREGLPPKDVKAAKRRLTDSAIFARDRLMAPAEILGSALSAGQSVADVEAWPERIEAVTPREVNAALRALLSSPHQIHGLLEPAAREEEK